MNAGFLEIINHGQEEKIRLLQNKVDLYSANLEQYKQKSYNETQVILLLLYLEMILRSQKHIKYHMMLDIVGKHVKHKAFGVGTITAIEGTSIAVEFDKVGLKRMGYEFCKEKKMLEFI